MSPQAEDFADLCTMLGRDPQSYTVVANTGSTSAVCGTPRRDNRVTTITCNGQAVVVFDREGAILKD